MNMHRYIIWLVVFLFVRFSTELQSAEILPGCHYDHYIQEIDGLWEEAYGQIYGGGLDLRLLDRMKVMLELCERAVAEDPSNYEYLWRYARAASQYASIAQSIEDGVAWFEICREWGLRGYEVVDKACDEHPERPEAFYWRNYCIGMYAMVGGIEPIINAVKEGFMQKAEESIFKGYAIDKTYLDYMPVYGFSQFLSHIPTIPFLVKGSRMERYQRAMCYHEEHLKYAGELIRGKKAFEWDMRAFFIAEFLLEAVAVLDLTPCDRRRYLAEAREWCELGLQGPRPYYVRKCRSLLADSRKWH